MLPSDLDKTREICFSPLPPGQAAQAVLLLTGLEYLGSGLASHKHCISIRYSLLHYTLEGLESALIAQKFHLENSLLCKIKRALIYYMENIQRENLHAPERLQKGREVFVQAYEHHEHGDHDETPAEWREYR